MMSMEHCIIADFFSVPHENWWKSTHSNLIKINIYYAVEFYPAIFLFACWEYFVGSVRFVRLSHFILRPYTLRMRWTYIWQILKFVIHSSNAHHSKRIWIWILCHNDIVCKLIFEKWAANFSAILPTAQCTCTHIDFVKLFILIETSEKYWKICFVISNLDSICAFWKRWM